MGDREPKSLRRERQAACARRDVGRPLLAFFRGLHEYLPAGRPGDRPGTDRDLVDPAALGVDRHEGAVSTGIRRHLLAAVAPGHQALPIARRRENAAVMDRDAALLAVRRG